MEGGIQKIVITRPMVSVEDESVGFLPGDMTQKMAPWTRPIFDIFHEYFDPLDVQDMIRRGVVEISPLAYMRGRTFKDAFIIADEMQNSTPNQMLMLTTRLGDNSRMVITGDLQQTDIAKENGLHDFVNKLEKFNETSSIIKLIKLDSQDIERSDVVKKILEIYDYIDKKPKTENLKNETINEKNITNYRIYNTNDDAALIPIQHVTRYHDVFYDRINF
jgi:phosphate starvation-inducible PhoH-like protein